MAVCSGVEWLNNIYNIYRSFSVQYFKLFLCFFLFYQMINLYNRERFCFLFGSQFQTKKCFEFHVLWGRAQDTGKKHRET